MPDPDCRNRHLAPDKNYPCLALGLAKDDRCPYCKVTMVTGFPTPHLADDGVTLVRLQYRVMKCGAPKGSPTCRTGQPFDQTQWCAVCLRGADAPFPDGVVLGHVIGPQVTNDLAGPILKEEVRFDEVPAPDPKPETWRDRLPML